MGILKDMLTPKKTGIGLINKNTPRLLESYPARHKIIGVSMPFKNKEAAAKYSKERRRNVAIYFIKLVYRNMKARTLGVSTRSPEVYKGLEILDKKSFYDFSINDKIFNLLFINWRKNNFLQSFSPSIDRIDNTKGYTLKNIRWTTAGENSRESCFRRWNKTKGSNETTITKYAKVD